MIPKGEEVISINATQDIEEIAEDRFAAETHFNKVYDAWGLGDSLTDLGANMTTALLNWFKYCEIGELAAEDGINFRFVACASPDDQALQSAVEAVALARKTIGNSGEYFVVLNQTSEGRKRIQALREQSIVSFVEEVRGRWLDNADRTSLLHQRAQRIRSRHEAETYSDHRTNRLVVEKAGLDKVSSRVHQRKLMKWLNNAAEALPRFWKSKASPRLRLIRNPCPSQIGVSLMRKISASFFSERDFTAVELEIERLRSQAKEEKSRIEHAISRDHRMSQDKLNQPDIGNDNQKPQTVVAKLVKIDEKKPKSVEPELEPQFDDFLFPVAEEPSSTLEENRPSAPRFIKRTALNLERRPYTDDVSNRDGVHFATGAGWLSLKWSKLARRCSGWMTYLAIAPRFNARNLASDCAIAIVLIAAIAGLSAPNLTIVAAVATLIIRASSYFISNPKTSAARTQE